MRCAVQPSPYRPGRVANALPGREQQLLAAEERLSRLCDLRELVGRVDVFTGARGFGKTSLLREIQRRADARGVLTVWVTAGEPHGLVAAVADALGEATRSWRTGLGPMIEQAKVSLNLGVASGEATLRPREQHAESGARAFERVVREVVEAGHGHHRKALAIFIDEVQSADAVGLRTLAYAWQHLQAEREDVPAAVFAAGLPDTSRTIVDAVSFGERFAYADLEPLNDTAVVRALAEASRALGVEWEPAALQLAVQEAGGYPFTVQLIGEHAWTAAGYPDSGAVITGDTARQACVLARRDMAQLIEDRFDRSSPAERQFMLAMSAGGDGPIRRSEIAERMNVTSNHVSNQRDSLLKSGLIRSSGHGMVEFTIPGMAAYLRTHTESGPRPVFWGFTRSGSEVLGRSRDEASTSPDMRPRPSPQPDRSNDLGR